MAAKDFTANQVRLSKLILTGGIGVDNLGLAIYSASRASDFEGGTNDSNLYSELGSEVAILVSGSANYSGRSKDNTHVLFRGNLGTSGSMHFMNNQHINASATLAIDFDGLAAHGDTLTEIQFVIPTAAGGEHDSTATAIIINESVAAGSSAATTNKIRCS